MTQSFGEFMVDGPLAHGVRRILGARGDDVFDAPNRVEGEMESIQTRHEEMAASMASAGAQFCGELGVCIATSGPGASHLTTELYDARLDHQPALAMAGQPGQTAIGGHYQPEAGLPPLVPDADETLRAPLALLRKKPDKRYREESGKVPSKWRGRLKRRALEPAGPVKPTLLTWEREEMVIVGAARQVVGALLPGGKA